MSRTIDSVSFPLDLGDFVEIVDVRSPGEFAEDHISGAINLPVLSDEERTEVGTIYKQVSAFEARKIGAALVSANIGRHLENHFRDKPKDYRPLVYCWRGGQRSGSLATVLSDVGWNPSLLNGGYKTYRAEVVATIERCASESSLVVLNGYTGAGKTLVLKALRELGAQVLDLEGMANHKGSVFGGDPDTPQPAQKRFESLIYDELRFFDPEKITFVEAESAKIGRLNLPNPLWQKMKAAPVIEIASPLEERARYLCDDYEDWLGDVDRIEQTLDRLVGFHSHEKIEQWKERTRKGEWLNFTEELLRDHYDQRYTVEGTGNYSAPVDRVDLPHHDENTVRGVARVTWDKALSLTDDCPASAGTSEP